MKRATIFVMQPHDEVSAGVLDMVASAAAKANASVFWIDSIDVGDSFAERILHAIETATLLIADVTSASPHVMYQVGYAQSHRKPLILIASSSRAIPFDLAGSHVLIYDLDRAYEFIERLTLSIEQAIKNPKAFVGAEASAEREKLPNVFVSYSHPDRDYLDRLLVHLKPLEKEGLIDLWVDSRLRVGDRWKKEIEKALNRATVAILLVSADFLASDFITDNELPPILRNAEEKGTRIIPVIVKPCRFTRDKNLRHFQAINDPKDALILLSEGDREMQYDAVAAEVERFLRRG